MTWNKPYPEPLEMLLTMTMPIGLRYLSRLLSKAYCASLPSTPHLMVDKLPNLTPNLPPVSFLVWNVQGAGSQAFWAALREVLRVKNPTVVALLETHMGGDHAKALATKPGFRGHMRMDAQGFSRERNNKPLLLGGDFNDTGFSWERSSSCEETKKRTAKFNTWIEDMELRELDSSGPAHTWAMLSRDKEEC
ncbi:RNA 2' 3'-cyclic phosphodiesterase [Bienertia sinuspersici]